MKHTTKQGPEEWRDVDGYEGIYQVSNAGRVRSLDRINAAGRRIKGRMLRPAPNSRGYLCLSLHKDGDGGRSHLVHRLVALAFLEAEPEQDQINHKDGDKLNNAASNLEWCTGKQNVQHSLRNGLHAVRGEHNGRAKLGPVDVAQIRALYAAGRSRSAIAARFGIRPEYVNQIVRRVSWKHL